MEVINYDIVGENLKRILKQKKMKKYELAIIVGCDNGILSSYLSGKVSPKVSRLQEIAAALNVDVRYFFKPEEEWIEEMEECKLLENELQDALYDFECEPTDEFRENIYNIIYKIKMNAKEEAVSEFKKQIINYVSM